MSPSKKTPRKAVKKPARKPAPVRRPKAATKVPVKKAPPAKEAPKAKKKPPAAAPAPRKVPEVPAERDPALVAAAAQDRAEKAVKQKAVRDVRKPAKARPRAAVLPDIVKPGLGGRWECFRCGAKFYDLNRPEPTCPKCGADQRDKPREKPATPAPQPERPRRDKVPMGGLLEEEEEPIEEYEGDEEDLGLDADAFLTETPDGAEEEEDVDVTVLEEE
jgi:hypothetical protein